MRDQFVDCRVGRPSSTKGSRMIPTCLWTLRMLQSCRSVWNLGIVSPFLHKCIHKMHWLLKGTHADLKSQSWRDTIWQCGVSLVSSRFYHLILRYYMRRHRASTRCRDNIWVRSCLLSQRWNLDDCDASWPIWIGGTQAASRDIQNGMCRRCGIKAVADICYVGSEMGTVLSKMLMAVVRQLEILT